MDEVDWIVAFVKVVLFLPLIGLWGTVFQVTIPSLFGSWAKAKNTIKCAHRPALAQPGPTVGHTAGADAGAGAAHEHRGPRHHASQARMYLLMQRWLDAAMKVLSSACAAHRPHLQADAGPSCKLRAERRRAWCLCRNNRMFHYGMKFYIVVAGTSVVLISLTAHFPFIAANRTFYLMLALIVTCVPPAAGP